MLHVFVAALADLEVRGPTVPESCAVARNGRTQAAKRNWIIADFISNEKEAVVARSVEIPMTAQKILKRRAKIL